MDEVFGRENFVAVIVFRKTGGQTANLIGITCDYLIWYGRDISQLKYRQLHVKKKPGIEEGEQYRLIELPDGQRRRATDAELSNPIMLPYYGAKIFRPQILSSAGYSAGTSVSFQYHGVIYEPPPRWHWKTSHEGIHRLAEANRIIPSGKKIDYVRYLDDFPVAPITDIWDDTMGAREMLYAVQTNTKVVERCILMTTDPGDLVFDPTCGSGTTAYCAEKWGRRWITCDTSRVALAIARQRLMTARFDYYELLDPERVPAGGFKYETVPHITLESIAKNTEIDVIAAKYQPEIDKALADLNRAVGENWQEWEVPREINKNWNKKAQEAHQRFWNLKRAKRQEIDNSIQRNAPQETLYDRPFIKRGVVRVSGPFTVEAIPPPAISIPEATPIPQYEA
jgi:adenine-specific DNA-methyltransferase